MGQIYVEWFVKTEILRYVCARSVEGKKTVQCTHCELEQTYSSMSAQLMGLDCRVILCPTISRSFQGKTEIAPEQLSSSVHNVDVLPGW